MAQHDYIIANQSGAAFRADLNNGLAAIVSQNSGAAQPSTTYAYQWWADTTTGLLKIRNAANNAWITLFQLDGEWTTLAIENGTAAAPSLYFKDSGTDTGIFSPGADQLGIATNGVERVEFGTTEVVFNDGGADVDFRVEGDTNPDLFKIDAGLDEVQVANLNGGPLAGARNRIINGDMRIDQRNGGGSVTPALGGFVYTVDRWNAYVSQNSKCTIQQNAGSVTPPVGFTNYLGVTSSSAYSIGSTDLFFLNQAVEGFNTADLAWGTANAKTVALSFWVRSSLAGTFGGALLNNAADRSYPFSYSIPTANTWTQISVTIAGDTTGTWLTTNGLGIRVAFGFGVGSTYGATAGSWAAGQYWSATGATSVVGTNGATFFITGVQLEPGTVTTPFERRSFGQELALCQRYYEHCEITWGSLYSTTTGYASANFAVTKRTTPTISLAGTVLNVNIIGTGNKVTSSTSAQSITSTGASTIYTGMDPTGMAIGLPLESTNLVKVSAEL